jgi:hypothetical protein
MYLIFAQPSAPFSFGSHRIYQSPVFSSPLSYYATTFYHLRSPILQAINRKSNKIIEDILYNSILSLIVFNR